MQALQEVAPAESYVPVTPASGPEWEVVISPPPPLVGASEGAGGDYVLPPNIFSEASLCLNHSRYVSF